MRLHSTPKFFEGSEKRGINTYTGTGHNLLGDKRNQQARRPDNLREGEYFTACLLGGKEQKDLITRADEGEKKGVQVILQNVDRKLQTSRRGFFWVLHGQK